jgi:hypothetical protein
MAWQNGSKIVGHRSTGEDFEVYRAPLQSWGGSIRVNFLGIPFRFDYAKPLNRTYSNGYWTVSLGPTF